MNYRNSKPNVPLVCPNVPFVGNGKPFDLPSVGSNTPSVDIIEKSGFTLIELMVALVIVGILAAMAAPAMSTFIANQRISGQANDLMADLLFARSESVKRGMPVTVCKTSNPNAASPTCNTTVADRWTAGRLIFIDSSNVGQVDAGEMILRIRQQLDGSSGGTGNLIIGDGVSTGTANRVTFGATGASHLTAESQLTVCDKRGDPQGMAVAVASTGRARVATKGKDKDGNNITACP